MKKIYSLLIATVLSGTAVKSNCGLFNQNCVLTGNRVHNMNAYNFSLNGGRVGINVANPDRSLVVNGDIGFYYSGNRSWSGIRRNWVTTTFFNDITGTPHYTIYEFRGLQKSILSMTQGGTVIIGTKQYSDYSGYHLAVEGKIGAREIEVKLGAWADYVFSPSYKLQPLTAVKQFIKEKGHLPNMPSEQEVVKKGVSLGDMAKMQQEKIEELTLYLIQQQEQINALQEQLNSLRQN